MIEKKEWHGLPAREDTANGFDKLTIRMCRTTRKFPLAKHIRIGIEAATRHSLVAGFSFSL